VNVEVVVAGTLGALAKWTMPQLSAEGRQVLLVSAANTLPTLNHLTARGLEVLTIREASTEPRNDARVEEPR
jgi:hypothetical protein